MQHPTIITIITHFAESVFLPHITITTTNQWREKTTRVGQRPCIQQAWLLNVCSRRPHSVVCTLLFSERKLTIQCILMCWLWSWPYFCRPVLSIVILPRAVLDVDALEVNTRLVRRWKCDGLLRDAIDTRLVGGGLWWVRAGLGRVWRLITSRYIFPCRMLWLVLLYQDCSVAAETVKRWPHTFLKTLPFHTVHIDQFPTPFKQPKGPDPSKKREILRQLTMKPLLIASEYLIIHSSHWNNDHFQRTTPQKENTVRLFNEEITSLFLHCMKLCQVRKTVPHQPASSSAYRSYILAIFYLLLYSCYKTPSSSLEGDQQGKVFDRRMFECARWKWGWILSHANSLLPPTPPPSFSLSFTILHFQGAERPYRKWMNHDHRQMLPTSLALPT